jgi:hypothetical protein
MLCFKEDCCAGNLLAMAINHPPQPAKEQPKIEHCLECKHMKVNCECNTQPQQKMVNCSACNGSGGLWMQSCSLAYLSLTHEGENYRHTCPQCEGKGKVVG